MRSTKKKMLAGIIAGAVLVAGGLGCYSAQAAQTDDSQAKMERQGRPGRHQPPQMDNEAVAEHISGAFQVDKDEVLAALKSNQDFREVGQAAMLAKVSGKSFADVMKLKTDKNGWQDVEQELGVTREQIKAEMDELMAIRIADHGNVDQGTAKALLANGYQERDIEMAGLLAKESGKDIQSVLDRKKINNRWEDVAAELGVDADKLHQFRGPGGPDGERQGGFGGGHPGRPHGNPPMGGMPNDK